MSVLLNRSYIDDLNCSRVYCCLAFKDADILNEIASDIFSCYDEELLISFRDDIQKGDKRRAICLSEVQLMIAIISSEFLNQSDDDGSMADYTFAIENNIPILPIIIESGIEELFNEKCGKLELIFKYRDGYQEILKDSLSRILANNEIKRLVREHFYGNIFLSYRREDLKYMQESIRNIHKIKSCEDVGVWYDGALVPGRDYEEEIFEQLKRCDFVLMMITPRLLEEGNFIMKAYPNVRKMGIRILPFIAEEVDVKEISFYYNGLFDEYPKGITSVEKLKEVVSNIYPNHEEVWDAEHFYYIGLANLYGIDFEKNADKALLYLRNSAEQGYISAIEKLVEIFEYGRGVKSDLKSAIKYQRDYVEALKKTTELPCDRTIALVKATLKLGDMLKNYEKYDEAQKTYRAVFSYFDLESGVEQKNEYYLALASIYEHLGILDKLLGKYEDAYNNFLLAAHCIEDAERVSDNSMVRENSMFEYSRIAEHMAMTVMELEDSNLILASNYILIALRPYELILIRDELDNQKRKELSRLYYKMGIIEQKRFEKMWKNEKADKKALLDLLSDIRVIFKNALEYCTETDYNESIKDIMAYHQLILIYEELKNTYYLTFLFQPVSPNLAEYENYLKIILDICMNVRKDKIASNALMQKINECIHMGEFFAVRKHRDKAVDFYKLALEGMRGYGFAENDENIVTVKRLISQLS